MSHSSDLEPSSTLVIASDVLSSRLGSEHVMLNLRDGTYYGLDAVGSEIWKLLEKPITVAEICRTIEAAFDVEPERCRRDVLRLLGELVERQLIELRNPT